MTGTSSGETIFVEAERRPPRAAGASSSIAAGPGTALFFAGSPGRRPLLAPARIPAHDGEHEHDAEGEERQGLAPRAEGDLRHLAGPPRGHGAAGAGGRLRARRAPVVPGASSRSLK